MAADPALRRFGEDFLVAAAAHGYSYNFSWLGRPIIQYPQDLVAMQEIVWRVRPDLIIETGIAHGGSTIFFASLLELIGGDGRVLAVDIDIRPHNRAAIESHPLAKRVTMIEGSSTDRSVAAKVTELAAKCQSVMVFLDSNHTHDHVLRELKLYSPLVTIGSFLIVMDTVVELMPEGAYPDRPWAKGNSPMTAVKAFLAQDGRFCVDAEVEAKLVISAAPQGYLRCIAAAEPVP